nr:SDR family oxidoreductase [Nocardia miyunensis]
MRAVYPEGPQPEDVAEIPMRRFGIPAEVGALATFLASDQAAYITGTTINVDGGLAKTIF